MGVTGVNLLKSIVIVVIITLIAIFIFSFVPPVKSTLIEKVPGFKELLAEHVELAEDVSTFQNCLGPLEEVEHICDNGNCISTSGNPHQPSEIACIIADEIYSDFTTNGYARSRLNERRCNCWRNLCLLNIGYFKIDSSVVYRDDWNTWMQVHHPDCKIPGPPDPDVQSRLDEIYFNFELDGRTWGGDPFCGGAIFVDQRKIYFGNDNCGNPGPGNTWGSGECDLYCGNDQDKIYWSATAPGGDEYIIDDSPEVDWPNSETLDRDDFIYIYGLVWGPDIDDRNIDVASTDKRYGVMFVKFPVQQTGVNDFDFIRNIFENDLKRRNRIGLWYQEVRRVADVIVDLPGDVREVDLRTDVSNWAGTEVIFEQCKYEDDGCLYTEPDNIEVCRDSYTKMWEEFKIQPITFLANVTENGWIYAGRYRVVIENWYGPYKKAVGWFNIGTDHCFEYIDRTISLYPVP